MNLQKAMLKKQINIKIQIIKTQTFEELKFYPDSYRDKANSRLKIRNKNHNSITTFFLSLPILPLPNAATLQDQYLM